MSDDLQIVTKSRLSTYNLCQRLEYLTYQLGYRSLAPRPDADRGTIFHDGLDAWFSAHMRGEPMMAMAEATAALSKSRDEKAPAFDHAQFAKMEVMMAAYDARWTPSMVDWEVLGVEVEFIAVIPGRKRLRVAGKLDKLLRRRSDGTIWFMEHKTVAADLSEGSVYWQRLRMDPQVSIYYQGTRVLGHEPAGCLYDVIAWPESKPYKATPAELRKYTRATAKEPSRLYANQRAEDETVDEFRQRVATAVAANPESFFARAEVVRLESELEESARDVEEVALQIRRGPESGHVARNPGACFQWNRPCQFLEHCSGLASLDDRTKFERLDVVHPELKLSPTRDL